MDFHMSAWLCLDMSKRTNQMEGFVIRHLISLWKQLAIEAMRREAAGEQLDAQMVVTSLSQAQSPFMALAKDDGKS